MEIVKSRSELGKVYLKRYTSPLQISKRINDIQSKINKIYKNFYLSATDIKRQKELEEYLKNEQNLKNKYKIFIKIIRIEFKRKINLKELYPLQSVKNKDSKNIFFNIIINKNKNDKNLPYIQPIKGANIIKYNSMTEPNKLNILGVKKNKIKYNNKKIANFILNNKKVAKSYKINKDLKYRNKNNVNIIQFKNQVKIKYKDLFKNKNSSKINLKKKINIHSADINKNKLGNVKSSSRNIIEKINLFNDNNNYSENRNFENILSPLNIDVVQEQNFLSNDNHDNNLEKINKINEIQEENNLNDGIYLHLNLSEEKNLFNKFKNLYFSKSNSLKSINSISGSNNKEIISPKNDSVKYSIESFKSKTYKTKINLFTKRKTNSIYEHNMKAFRLLPILNKSYYSTMDLSNKIKKNIKYYKKESKYETKKSKKEANRINKKYFKEIESPMKMNFRMYKKRSWSKSEETKSLFNFKYNYDKKVKSPLAFVKEYNKLRNRRRRNNNKITENIGFRISPYKEKKKKEINSYFGLSFKNY